MFLILAAMNRAATQTEPDGRATYLSLRWLFLYLGGLIVVGQMFFLSSSPRTTNSTPHSPTSPSPSHAGRLRHHRPRLRPSLGLHHHRGHLHAFTIAEILILPLFPATPKLGPVYYPVTHMVPANFPALLIVPAIALDLLWQRTSKWKPWANGGTLRHRLHLAPRRRRVAFRHLPALEGQREPILRHHLLRLLLPVPTT